MIYLAVLVLLVAITPAFAEEFTVSIIEGNVDPRCTESQCHDPETLNIRTGDTVTWINEDVPAHTVVSGDPFGGQSGIFDSGLILPEKSFSHVFSEDGAYSYYCILHPWATGVVTVSGQQLQTEKSDTQLYTFDKALGLIGQQVGTGKSFTMSYKSQGDISQSIVDTKNNSILFIFAKPAPAGDQITLEIHKDMISQLSAIDVNGVAFDSFEVIRGTEFDTLNFTAESETWEIRAYGSQVVPEFGSVTLLILTVTVSVMLFVSRYKLPQI